MSQREFDRASGRVHGAPSGAWLMFRMRRAINMALLTELDRRLLQIRVRCGQSSAAFQRLTVSSLSTIRLHTGPVPLFSGR